MRARAGDGLKNIITTAAADPRMKLFLILHITLLKLACILFVPDIPMRIICSERTKLKNIHVFIAFTQGLDKYAYKLYANFIFNRPGVAGAVLQIPPPFVNY